jgi:hypothetical protein
VLVPLHPARPRPPSHLRQWCGTIAPTPLSNAVPALPPQSSRSAPVANASPLPPQSSRSAPVAFACLCMLPSTPCWFLFEAPRPYGHEGRQLSETPHPRTADAVICCVYLLFVLRFWGLPAPAPALKWLCGVSGVLLSFFGAPRSSRPARCPAPPDCGFSVFSGLCRHRPFLLGGSQPTQRGAPFFSRVLPAPSVGRPPPVVGGRLAAAWWALFPLFLGFFAPHCGGGQFDEVAPLFYFFHIATLVPVTSLRYAPLALLFCRGWLVPLPCARRRFASLLRYGAPLPPSRAATPQPLRRQRNPLGFRSRGAPRRGAPKGRQPPVTTTITPTITTTITTTI